ncbi:MAG: dehydrogenase [Paludibacteraceae bacterium]|nr:dehydrogenase [Paludibacteraceae bacterium]MBP5136723.1 dehydrogenase [Paludibacteraceae bacterium]
MADNYLEKKMEEYERRKKMMAGKKKVKKPSVKPQNAEPKDGER